MKQRIPFRVTWAGGVFRRLPFAFPKARLPRAARWVWLLVTLLGALTPTASAHEAGLSHADAKLGADSLELTIAYDLEDVRRMLPPTVRLATDSSDQTIAAAATELRELAGSLVAVSGDGRVLTPKDTIVEFTPSDHLGFRFVFSGSPANAYVFHFPNLANLPSSHRELFSFVDADGFLRFRELRAARDPAVTITLRETEATVRPVNATAAPNTSGVLVAESKTKAAGGSFAGYIALAIALLCVLGGWLWRRMRIV